MKIFTPLLLAMLTVLCNPSAQAEVESRHSISADGTEVSDNTTSLIWRRCAEGMKAGANTCSGIASSFKWEEAQVHAKGQATTDKHWRLPTFAELATIADSRLNSLTPVNVVQKGLDERELISGITKVSTAPIIFPQTPSTFFWSLPPPGTPTFGAWYIFYNGGGVGDYGRIAQFRVRLVRSAK